MYHLSLLLVPTLLLAALPATMLAGEVKHGFLPLVHKDAEGESKYHLFVPHGYTGKKEFPLILFLHGAGRGDDGLAPVLQGIANGGIKFKDQEKKFPFLVIFPCSARPRVIGRQAGGTLTAPWRFSTRCAKLTRSMTNDFT